MHLIVLNLINVITLFTLAFLLIILPGNAFKRNFYFILLLLFLGLDLILIHFQIVGQLSVETYVPIGLSFIVGYGPAYYFYCSGKSIKEWRLFLLHTLIAISGIWGIFLLVWLDVYLVPGWILTSYFVAVLSAYFIASKPLKNRVEQQWLNASRWWYLAMVVLFLVESIWMNVDFYGGQRVFSYFMSVFFLINFCFAIFSFWTLVRDPSHFGAIKLIKSNRNEEKEIAFSEIEILEDFLSKKEVYRSAELTRDVVMQATGLPLQRISEIVNYHYKRSFNDWVNDMRIADAKDLIVNTDLSVKEIYFSVGFNSKSTFNQAFKKREGITPTAYRQKWAELREAS